jgi:hypothetical protein
MSDAWIQCMKGPMAYISETNRPIGFHSDFKPDVRRREGGAGARGMLLQAALPCRAAACRGLWAPTAAAAVTRRSLAQPATPHPAFPHPQPNWPFWNVVKAFPDTIIVSASA